MTRRYAWQRHTTRVVRTFIRLRSRTRQSATAGTVVTQSFNPTLRPFLYSQAKLTCGMSKLPLCRSASNIQLTRFPRVASVNVFLESARDAGKGLGHFYSSLQIARDADPTFTKCVVRLSFLSFANKVGTRLKANVLPNLICLNYIKGNFGRYV